MKEFLTIIHSFNLVRWVSGPTHEQGHTLDFVFTYGLSVSNIDIRDRGISDHMTALFDVEFSHPKLKVDAPTRR